MMDTIPLQTDYAAVWYYFSIYYSRKEWHGLLPFIRQFYEEKALIIKQLFISFSNMGGESIRCAFLFHSSPREDVRVEIENFFCSVLKESPSSFTDSFPYGEKLWMDYPANHLEWYNFDMPVLILRSSEYLNFSHLLSLLIIDLMNEESSDEDGCVGLATFFMAGLLRSSSLNPQMITDILEEFRPEEINDNHTPENKAIIDSYFSFVPDKKETKHCFNLWLKEIEAIYCRFGLKQAFINLANIIRFSLNIDYRTNLIILDLLYFGYTRKDDR
jgi:hypothetical protein